MSIRFAPWILVAALAPGCSLILDTGDLPQRPDGRPGEIDAGPPDSRPFDANPMNFSVDSADPAELLEGAGAKGMPVVVRFYGMNIIDPAVTAEWSDTFVDPITVVEVHASNTFDEVAVALRVPVRPDLDDGACNGVQIHFGFMQAGATMNDAVDVPLHCLDELAGNDTLDSSKTYSRIQLTSARHFPPGDPAPVFRATEDIEISAVIDVDSTSRIAGAGSSCDGGNAGMPSSCTGGGAAGPGGGGLDHGMGGGGGGYFTDGSGGGLAVTMHGGAMLVPLAMSGTDGNHGSGGGGGGAGTLGSPGIGGGGGGTIQLIAGGEIIVSTGALVRAKGGDGTAGTGLAATGSGGGGGGGSGGAVLVRAGAGVRFNGGAFGWISTPRGLGGTAPVNQGAPGAEGRARIDQPVATPDPMAMITVGGKAAGPAWEVPPSAIVTTPEVQLRLRAQSGTYGVILNGVEIPTMNGNVTIVSGSVPVTITGLDRGRNAICALYAGIGAANAGLPEARTCLEVVYVPVDP